MLKTAIPDDVFARNIELVVHLSQQDGMQLRRTLDETWLKVRSGAPDAPKVSFTDLKVIDEALDIQQTASDLRKPI